MTVQRNSKIVFVGIMFVLALIITPADTFAACNQPDAPDCPCFDNTGVWNPAGASIQSVAIQTVGTRESCVDNGGKPYYQMVLGSNSELSALLKAWLLSLPWWLAPDYEAREAWCSEAISYWHREASVPYSGGYRTCGWHCDWLNQNVGELKSWYTTEEGLGGRGRWIQPGDVDYENYVLGVTLPVPGAYVSWRTYDDSSDTWVGDGESHSLMINEMWLHKDAHGDLFQVEVTLLEGNSGNRVKNTRHWDDVLSLTPQGSDWINTNKKIYGFGVDLNSAGQPVYDSSRLHLVPWLFVQAPPQTKPVMTTDPVWEQHYSPRIPALIAYAQLLRTMGEPNVMSSSPALRLSGIPDGQQVYWHFPKGLQGPVEVDIDLLDVHPLLIKGIELTWDIAALPGNYKVQFATAGQPYQQAVVPDLPDPSQAPQGTSIPVPAVFATTGTGTGAEVRYVKLIFPDTFEQDAILQQLRFRYDPGPMTDTEMCQYTLAVDLNDDCRVDFTDFALLSADWLVDCVINPDDPACVPQ